MVQLSHMGPQNGVPDGLFEHPPEQGSDPEFTYMGLNSMMLLSHMGPSQVPRFEGTPDPGSPIWALDLRLNSRIWA